MQKRFVAVPSISASPDNAFKTTFKMPSDTASDKLILSVHMYTPYEFAMQSPGDKTFTSAHKNTLDYYFSTLNTKFISKGIPVIIGEYGAVNKNNLSEREKWFEYFISKSHAYGIATCLWDNNSWQVTNNDYNEKFGYYNRQTQTWYFPSLIKIIVEQSGGTPGKIEGYKAK